MATCNNHGALCFVRDHYVAVACFKHGQRWFYEKGPVDMDWRPLCDCYAANLYLAYFTAYRPFHEAHFAEANHTDTVYGTDICIECGESMFRLLTRIHIWAI